MPKQDTFQDLVLGEMREGQELWRWLYTEIRNAIADGRLRSGSRLPATRNIAKQYGISRGTVVAAFNQLKAEGYTTHSSSAGTYVRTTPRSGLSHTAKRMESTALMQGTSHPELLPPIVMHRFFKPVILSEYPSAAMNQPLIFSQLSSGRESQRESCGTLHAQPTDRVTALATCR